MQGAGAVGMHLDIPQARFDAIIYRKNAARQILAARFVRHCTTKMHMEMSQQLILCENC